MAEMIKMMATTNISSMREKPRAPLFTTGNLLDLDPCGDVLSGAPGPRIANLLHPGSPLSIRDCQQARSFKTSEAVEPELMLSGWLMVRKGNGGTISKSKGS